MVYAAWPRGERRAQLFDSARSLERGRLACRSYPRSCQCLSSAACTGGFRRNGQVMQNTKLSDYVADFLAQSGYSPCIRHFRRGVHPSAALGRGASGIRRSAVSRTSGGDGGGRLCAGEWRTWLRGRHQRAGRHNMITGIAGAWFDSIPVIYLTGQVTTFRMKGDTGVRQLGFQET